MFEELCPGEEFLPTPPDPKDIVYETPTDSTDPSPTDNTDPSPTDSTDASHTDNTDDPNSDDNPNTDPAAGDRLVLLRIIHYFVLALFQKTHTGTCINYIHDDLFHIPYSAKFSWISWV